jgi:hypothetical protein
MADIEVFVPGRLCILGEHSDWAAEYRDINPTVAYGMTLVCATNEGLFAKCRGYTSGHMKFEFVNGNGNIETFDVSLNVAELIKRAELGGFFSYVAGAAAAVILDYFPGGASSPYLEEQGSKIDHIIYHHITHSITLYWSYCRHLHHQLQDNIAYAQRFVQQCCCMCPGGQMFQ